MTQTLTKPRTRYTAEPCRHHWVIDTPDGAMSGGVCRLCGEHKLFANVFEDTIREELRPQRVTTPAA